MNVNIAPIYYMRVKEFGGELNGEKTKYKFMYRYQTTAQNRYYNDG
jgi:hypothetical protein